ncbi:hypothetical protein Q7Z16_10575 [Glaesserella parasuis]|uniref:hypothetical protein n=1 Tax=Glaesserella parasuis TaxID=738 RepID=UPI0013666D54|nr:hypothetical protein [Glaesserella parasuis]MDP0286711.1 hypothetical protein [Glaesserella parasuis]MDP0290889.1 hypothetical protein [Glaesserella parasuis]MDP0292986.1 hypothetical protein [Glaesserella parasuis]MDP0297201.1 hypothetical protein [Glaesserella parasuis]MDP0301484.1 hypothetical protein [Glaesserella parasuis]
MYGIDIYKPSTLVFKECIKMRMGYIERPYPFFPMILGYGSATGMRLERIQDNKWLVGFADYEPYRFSLFTQSVDMTGSYDIDYFDVAIYSYADKTLPEYGVLVGDIPLKTIHPDAITVEVVKTGEQLSREKYIRVPHPKNTLGLIGEELLVFDNENNVVLNTGLGSLARRFRNYTSYLFPAIPNHRYSYKYKAISHFLKIPTPIKKGLGEYGVEVYDDNGNVIYNSNTSQPIQELGRIQVDVTKAIRKPEGLFWIQDYIFKNAKITHIALEETTLPRRIVIIRNRSKILDFGYKIVDDTVKVHCNVQPSDYKSEKEIPFEFSYAHHNEGKTVKFIVFGVPNFKK